MAVLTRKQLGKLTKEEIIDELLTVNSIHEDLANLTSSFDEFLEKYVQVESELAVSKNCMMLYLSVLCFRGIEIKQHNCSE